MSKPTSGHMIAAKRILRYLRGVPDLRIMYSRSGNKELLGYSDSSYATADPERSRSTTSTMFFLSGGLLVHFSSQLQKLVAQSTTEAELIALNSRAKSGIYLLGVLQELGWRNFKDFQIYCDSQGALVLPGNLKYSSRSKHVALKFASLCEWMEEKKLVLNFVSSKNQLSDIMTKFCGKHIFISLRDRVMNFKREQI